MQETNKQPIKQTINQSINLSFLSVGLIRRLNRQQLTNMSHLSGDMWPEPLGSMIFPSRSRGLCLWWRWCLCLDLCSSRSCLSVPLMVPMVASASAGPPSSGLYRRLPLPFIFFDACNSSFQSQKVYFNSETSSLHWKSQ